MVQHGVQDVCCSFKTKTIYQTTKKVVKDRKAKRVVANNLKS
jgi:hypothetical protein